MIYKIENIQHCYNDKPAFKAKSLTIPKASITGLAGPNGAGKSTLLNILALIQKPTSGIVYYNGKPVQPFAKSTKSRITLLNQEPYLLKRSVFQNVAYGLKLRKDITDLTKRVRSALEAVGLENEFASRAWSELSGGEAQRVALAARLILTPDVLILDEPTANVDAESRILIRKAALNARKEHGTTLIISSHDRDWLYDVSDTVLNIFGGEIIQGDRISPVFGPWEPAHDCYYKKTGTNFLIPPPPTPKSVALISADAIGLCCSSEIIPESHFFFKTQLKSIVVDKKSNKLYGSIKSDDLTLISDLGNRLPESFSPEPGQSIFVFYNPSRIKFTT